MRRPPFGDFTCWHGVAAWRSAPLIARGARATTPLAKPFECESYPGDRNTEAGQTPDRIGHAKERNCEHSGRNAGHKGEHPPDYNEAPGAFVTSHSRLQKSGYYLAGLQYSFTPTLNARKLLSVCL